MEDSFDHTPTPLSNSIQSKKTRMGSTDEQGNRLSNLPGEIPLRTSVTPYDDNADTLISKVEKIAKKALPNESSLEKTNVLGTLKNDKSKLL